MISGLKNTTARPRIGIDIGRVIIGGGGADTSFFGRDEDEAKRLTPSIPGAFAGVAALVERFEGEAFLVSKCGARIQGRSLAWLDHHEFWTRTGLARERVRFCRERADKAIHARELALTHFVDDRRDVLRHLVGLVDHLYLFGPQPRRERGVPRTMRAVPNWNAVLDAVAIP